jgi:hypothetical protein
MPCWCLSHETPQVSGPHLVITVRPAEHLAPAGPGVEVLADVQVAARSYPRLSGFPGRTVGWSGRPPRGEQLLDGECGLVVCGCDLDHGPAWLCQVCFGDWPHAGTTGDRPLRCCASAVFTRPSGEPCPALRRRLTPGDYGCVLTYRTLGPHFSMTGAIHHWHSGFSGENCGATRSDADQCSSAGVQGTIARATHVVLSLDRANERRHHVVRDAA